LPDCLEGKLYTNERPGLGATPGFGQGKQIGKVTTPISQQIYERQDGSLTHW
jgi:hypothetical protein